MRMREGQLWIMDTRAVWLARSTSWPLMDKMTSPVGHLHD